MYGEHLFLFLTVVWLQAENFVVEGDTIPYVTYHHDCFYQAWAERTLAARDCRLRVVFECPSLDGMVNAVRNGLGIGLVNFNVLEQRYGGRYAERGLIIERHRLPQPPPVQHVARFAAGLPTEQMDKLLELIRQELIPVS